MDVILQQKVDRLGDMGDVVRVKPGYARNYLIPRGIAVEATRGNLKTLEIQKQQADYRPQKAAEDAKVLAEKLTGLKISIPVQVGEEDKVFGSVTSMAISDALSEEGFNVDKKDVLLEEPIKALGVFDVSVKLHQDVETTVMVYVIKA